MEIFTVEDYTKIVQIHLTTGQLHPAITNWERIIVQENIGYFDHKYNVNDGAILRLEHRPMPIGQPIWGGWIETQIILVQPPTNNVHNLKPDSILFKRGIQNE